MRHASLRVALLVCGALAAAEFLGFAVPAGAQQLTPPGQIITPNAPYGALFTKLNPRLRNFPDYTVGQAIKTALSPDGGTLLVLTSGYNRLNGPDGRRIPADSNEYVFVIALAPGHLQLAQVLAVPNTFLGLCFAPDGNHFYVSGGVDNDVHVYSNSGKGWSESGTILLGTAGRRNRKIPGGENVMVANLAVSANSKILVAADISDDTLSVVELDNHNKVTQIDMRTNALKPVETNEDAGTPAHPMSAAEYGAVSSGGIGATAGVGGEAPYGVAIKGNTTAYVSSESDREIDVVDISKPTDPKVTARIPVKGSPNNVLLNKAQNLLLVAADNSDLVSVIDTSTNKVAEEIHTTAPAAMVTGPKQLPGAAPNSLALSPDEKTLYVTDGGMNAIAVIAFAPNEPHQVEGLIPTGWYPQSVSISHDGRTIYDVNSKSDPGPNAGNIHKQRGSNQYILQLEKAGLQAIPVPDARQLARLTKQVVDNNFLDTTTKPNDAETMAELHKRIQHIIYIVKENRTYDQILGDLDRGNGDPSLAEFGKVITPNQHKIAQQFVDLDDTLCAGEVSADGWPWSTSARETDLNVKRVPLIYGKRGTPGGDTAPDGPNGEKREGNIWDSVLRHGLTLRNYGFETRTPRKAPQVPDPYASHVRVSEPVWPALRSYTDPYFRSFDNAYPDFRRELEWEREFDQYVANKNLPDFEMVRFMHDHEGNFDTAMDGIDTPETETADNDYAVGKLIEKIAHSPYADSTLIFIIEDDAQSGPDHVNAHRTIAFVAGPYVKQGKVVQTRYSTVNMVRTMEDILGIGHLNLNDAYQPPMTDVFDLNQAKWDYTAITPDPIAKQLASALKKQHADQVAEFHSAEPAAYWARQTRGFDWRTEDKVPDVLFNQIIWKGLTGGTPYPIARNKRDYSIDRETVLKTHTIHLLYQDDTKQ